MDHYEFENNEYGNNQQRDGNKIRRGPGRRLAKEKRKRFMDQAVLNKYLSLPPEGQIEVNAQIEVLYRQHVQSQYEAQAAEVSNGQDFD